MLQLFYSTCGTFIVKQYVIIIIIIIIIYCTFTYQSREVTMSLVMNILPNELTEQHDSHQTDFREMLYLGPSLTFFDFLI